MSRWSRSVDRVLRSRLVLASFAWLERDPALKEGVSRMRCARTELSWMAEADSIVLRSRRQSLVHWCQAESAAQSLEERRSTPGFLDQLDPVTIV